uniref:Uncharacterized protein n=1 Tax=Mycoplasma feriruminatoris TaxID=1179777 RepID=A0A654II33_9MOLU|nr:hypothetical protein MF5293_00152 [Mycoplasma feriruminatoris]
MIKFNDKQEELTLVCLTEVNDKPYVVDADLSTSFISEDKKIYMVIKKDNKCLKTKIRNAFKKFVSTNKFNINVDVDSFLVFFDKCGCKKDAIEAIYESIAFETFDKVSYKKILNQMK